MIGLKGTVKYSTLALVAVAATLVADLTTRVNTFFGVSNGSTALVLVLNILTCAVLILFASSFSWKDGLPKSIRILLILTLIWNGYSFAKGAVAATDYWAWKQLFSLHLFMLTVPLALFLGVKTEHFRRTILFVALIVCPMSFWLVPAARSFDLELFARAVMPLFTLVLCAGYLKSWQRVFIFLMVIFSVGMDLSYRTNLMRLLFASVLSGIYLLQIRLPKLALNTLASMFFFLPIMFLLLALNGSFNVFRDSITSDKTVTVVEGGEVRDSPLEADTRSFLYEEVIQSMERRGSSFLVGQGAGTGYDSAHFAQTIVGASGRGGSEVGFLNTLMYSGAIGVALYGLMLSFAGFYGINRSQNYLTRLFGLFLLFKWALFFVEEIPRLDLNFLFTWFMIGACCSKNIRALDDNGVTLILRSQRNIFPRFKLRQKA